MVKKLPINRSLDISKQYTPVLSKVDFIGEFGKQCTFSFAKLSVTL
jgi:hypothetical protein